MYDLVILSETWLHDKISQNLEIQGYECFHLYGNKSFGVKKGRFSGGISVYFRSDLKPYIEILEANKNGVVWVKISENILALDSDIYLCSAYVPPKKSTVLASQDVDLFDEIESGISKYNRMGKTYIVGDLNSRTGLQPDQLEYDHYLDDSDDEGENIPLNQKKLFARSNEDHIVDENGRRLLNLCKTTGHAITNGRLHKDRGIGKFTFCSSRGLSVTDYLLAEIDSIETINDFEILNWSSFSDHAPIYFSFKLIKNADKPFIGQDTPTKSSKTIIYQADKELMFKQNLVENIEQLYRINDEDASSETSVEILTNYLHENAMKTFGKIKTSENTSFEKKSLWFDENCRLLKSQFKKARNEFVKRRTDENRHLFTHARTKYNYAKKKAKNKHKIKEGQKLQSISKTHPKKFWKSIKKCYKKKTNSSNNITVDSLFEHFNDLLNTDQNAEDAEISNDIHDEDLDLEITEEEVRKAILKQKNNKASGPDEISAEIIKSSIDIICPYLTKILNKLFNKSEYPGKWGLGYITPIFKGGDENDAKNYRGVTLNNILAKVYSQILLNRLNLWSIKHETISNCQFGFQKGKSTVDCVFLLHSIITKVLNSGQKLYCAFIDYEKCFDKIDRTILWQKLIKENISSKFTNAIKAMYSSVRSAVKHNGNISEKIQSTSGVKQGDPSSSLLFMYFVNDVIQNINTNIEGLFSVDEIKLFLIAYADDQVLFATSPASLQSLITDLENYCNMNKLKINSRKTKIMIFEKSSRQTSYNFYIYNERIEIVNSFRYLGILFFRNGNWYRTQKCISEHASKALYKLFSVFQTYEFKPSEKCKLFDILVGSILNYCSEVWGWNDGKDVELIHTKFCRRILMVNKSTNIDGLYGELARAPLAITRKINIIK